MVQRVVGSNPISRPTIKNEYLVTHFFLMYLNQIFSANNDKIFKKTKIRLFQKMRQNLLFLDEIGILESDLYLFHSKTSCEKKSDF